MIRRDRAALGFTLLELVIVIAITAILAVFVVFFLDTPVEAYLAQSRRAVLVDSADHVLRSVAADVRTALPSSLRWAAPGNVVAVEMLSTVGVARYYGVNEKSRLPPALEAPEELSIGSADPSFYTVGLFASTTGGYLSVDQQTLPGAYSLAAGHVMLPFAQPPSSINPVGLTTEEWVQCVPGCNFTAASPTNSVFVVSGPVSYLCDKVQHTLQRYSGYAVRAVEPLTDAALMAAGATRGLIAQNVSGCRVRIVPAPASGAFDQLLIFEVTLASSGETLTVFDEAAPEYVP